MRAVAALGGTAIYLLAHVAFRYRNAQSFNAHRSVCAVLLVALMPVALEIPALGSLAILFSVLALLIAYETVRFAEARAKIRHQLTEEPAPD